MIPRNWRLIKQSDICKLDNGQKLSDISFPYIDVKYLRGISKAKMVDSGNYVEKSSLIILVDGENSGEVFIVPENGYMGSTFRLLKLNNNIINTKFLRYFIETKKEIYKTNKQGSAIPHLNKKLFNEMLFPLPPLDEQQRIVDIIESLFSKLDKAKALAQNIIDNYGLRRSAILHKAFTGELTDTNLNITDFSEVANIKCNLVSPKDYLNYPHIAPDNIEKKTGRLTSYHTVAEDKVISNKHRFYPGQILYSKIRPYLSKVIVAEFDGLCSADMYPIESKGSIKYMWYYMLSDEFLNQASNAGSRTLLPKINQKELSKIKVPICKLEEQKEIVRILDSLLAKEQRTKELAEQVINEVDLMKKAILARAFRGELVINKIQ